MFTLLKKMTRKEGGQGLVEFALVLPVLLLLILGIIEFGWLLNGKITINSAAREGARTYAITQDDLKTEDAVKETSSLSGLSIVGVDISQSIDKVENKHVGIVEVKGEMKPLVGFFFKENVKLNSVAHMRLE